MNTHARAHRAALFGLLLPLTLALVGCDDGPSGPGSIRGANAPLVLAVNGLAETLALVRADSLTGVTNALTLGTYPNDVAVDSGGKRAVIVDSGDNDLRVVSLGDTLALAKRIDLGVGTNPYSVELDGRGHAFVSLLLTGEVARVDLVRGAVDWRAPVGRAPEGLLLVGSRLYVAITNLHIPDGYGPGEVAVLDAASGDSIARIAVGTNPQALALAPDGRIHVVCTGNYGYYSPAIFGSICVFDPQAPDPLLTRSIGGSPAAIAITTGGTAYVAGAAGGLVAYDAFTLVPRPGPVLAKDNLFDVVWDADRSRLFAADFAEDLLYVLDTRADTLLGTVPLGDGPLSLALRP